MPTPLIVPTKLRIHNPPATFDVVLAEKINQLIDFAQAVKERMEEPKEEILRFQHLPRAFGANTKLLVDFYAEGRKGKSIIFASPEGNFLSPKAVEQAIQSARTELIKELMKEVHKTKQGLDGDNKPYLWVSEIIALLTKYL